MNNMTDLEISKALALAIGWPTAKYFEWLDGVMVTDGTARGWLEFDYRDWEVAGPIAAKYDLFPYKFNGAWATNINYWEYTDTPQKAIALAVIEGAKK